MKFVVTQPAGVETEVVGATASMLQFQMAWKPEATVDTSDLYRNVKEPPVAVTKPGLLVP